MSTVSQLPSDVYDRLGDLPTKYGLGSFLVPEKHGFGGILKHRYTDFVVNEVDPSGTVVQLSDLGQKFLVKKNEQEAKTAEAPKPFEELKELVGDEVYTQLVALSKNSTPAAKESVIRIGGSHTKDERRSIHSHIRTCFGVFETDTAVDEKTNESYIRCRIMDKSQKGKGKRAKQGKTKFDDRNYSDAWDPNTPPYCHFTLYKEQTDTMAAISVICSKLGLRPRMFQFAGVKDRRAVTTQRCSVLKIRADKLAELNEKLRSDLIGMGSFSYENEPLTIGDLSGNRFTVTLRRIFGITEAEVGDLVDRVQQTGFVNYFGLQRFGTNPEVPTFTTGILILRQQYKEAVDILMNSRLPRYHQYNTVKELLDAVKDTNRAMRMVPRHMHIEKAILGGIERMERFEKQGKKGFTWKDVFERVSRPMRMMYLHSYQSYVWNHMVTARLEEHGPHPIVGDLVIMRPDRSAVKCGESWMTGKQSGDADEEEEDDDTGDVYAAGITPIHVLQPDDLENYTIADVVLPLPGSSVQYPLHNIGEKYDTFMKADDVEVSAFKSLSRMYAVPGGYRHIVATAKDIGWEWKQYSEKNGDLYRSNYADEYEQYSETLKSIHGSKDDTESLPENASNDTTTATDNGNSRSGNEACEQSGDPFTALQLQFTLPRGCYATVFLRELMKAYPGLTERSENDRSSGAQRPATDSTEPDAKKRKTE